MADASLVAILLICVGLATNECWQRYLQRRSEIRQMDRMAARDRRKKL